MEEEVNHDKVKEDLLKEIVELQATVLGAVGPNGELEQGEEWEESLAPLADLVERVLQHGLRNNDMFSWVWKSPTPGIWWSFLERNLPNVLPSFSMKEVKDLDRVKTDLGRGRAWIRYCINEKLLCEYLGCLFENSTVVKDWYQPYAFVRDEGNMASFHACCNQLESMGLTYELNDSSLNSSGKLTEDEKTVQALGVDALRIFLKETGLSSSAADILSEAGITGELFLVGNYEEAPYDSLSLEGRQCIASLRQKLREGSPGAAQTSLTSALSFANKLVSNLPQSIREMSEAGAPTSTDGDKPLDNGKEPEVMSGLTKEKLKTPPAAIYVAPEAKKRKVRKGRKVKRKVAIESSPGTDASLRRRADSYDNGTAKPAELTRGNIFDAPKEEEAAEATTDPGEDHPAGNKDNISVPASLPEHSAKEDSAEDEQTDYTADLAKGGVAGAQSIDVDDDEEATAPRSHDSPPGRPALPTTGNAEEVEAPVLSAVPDEGATCDAGVEEKVRPTTLPSEHGEEDVDAAPPPDPTDDSDGGEEANVVKKTEARSPGPLVVSPPATVPVAPSSPARASSLPTGPPRGAVEAAGAGTAADIASTLAEILSPSPAPIPVSRGEARKPGELPMDAIMVNVEPEPKPKPKPEPKEPESTKPLTTAATSSIEAKAATKDGSTRVASGFGDMFSKYVKEKDPESVPQSRLPMDPIAVRAAAVQGQSSGVVHCDTVCGNCGLSPIKGVAYRCIHCVNHHWCSACEELQPTHPSGHLFLKLRSALPPEAPNILNFPAPKVFIALPPADTSLDADDLNDTGGLTVVPVLSTATEGLDSAYGKLLTTMEAPGSLLDQNGMCFTCSAKIEEGSIVCKYSGRHFCRSLSCFHFDDTCVVPAYVLHKWDFTPKPVSATSKAFLDKLYKLPILDVHEVNPTLYERVSALRQLYALRISLSAYRDYILSCSHKEGLLRYLGEGRDHLLLGDPKVVSLQDLVELKEGRLLDFLAQLGQAYERHITHACETCVNKGHVCLLCVDPSPIYPFQFDKVVQCQVCSQLFHRDCYPPGTDCPRCARRRLS